MSGCPGADPGRVLPVRTVPTSNGGASGDAGAATGGFAKRPNEYRGAAVTRGNAGERGTGSRERSRLVLWPLADDRARVRSSDPPGELVPGAYSAPDRAAGGKLDGGEGPPCRRHAPRTDVGADGKHAPVSRGEDDVDGKTHRACVHRGAGSDHEGVVLADPLAAEQPAASRCRVRGELDTNSQYLIGTHIHELQLGPTRATQERLKECGRHRRG